MKVEVLYVAECPYQPEAVRLVREVLAAQGVAAEIREVLVTDEQMANDLRFPGSPTIRINGRDVDRDAQSPPGFALSCRLYSGSELIGLPPAEIIRRAIIEAEQEGGL